MLVGLNVAAKLWQCLNYVADCLDIYQLQNSIRLAWRRECNSSVLAFFARNSLSNSSLLNNSVAVLVARDPRFESSHPQFYNLPINCIENK